MYRGRLERDLKIWVAKGLISGDAANSILSEVDSRGTSFSVGRVLLILAACLLSLAVLLLVASNWEAIPRLARLAGIIIFIWVFFTGGALAAERGARTLSAALLILGAASIGGAISLVGQMYHLSGDMAVAALVWFLIVCLAAALFRSAALAGVAGFLSWLVFGVSYGDHMRLMDTNLVWLTPVMALVVLALVYWTGALRVRHTVYLLLIGLLVSVYGDYSSLVTAGVIAACGTVAYVVAALPQSPLHRFSANAGPAPEFYLFSVAALGLFLVHVDNRGVTDMVLLGLLTLAFAILGLGLSGRNNGAVRYLAYGVFAAECLYLASETVGSTLGTAGLFLSSGLIVSLVAWVVIRLEKRFAPVKQPRENENG